jgi:hypothetical protein
LLDLGRWLTGTRVIDVIQQFTFSHRITAPVTPTRQFIDNHYNPDFTTGRVIHAYAPQASAPALLGQGGASSSHFAQEDMGTPPITARAPRINENWGEC